MTPAGRGSVAHVRITLLTQDLGGAGLPTPLLLPPLTHTHTHQARASRPRAVACPPSACALAARAGSLCVMLPAGFAPVFLSHAGLLPHCRCAQRAGSGPRPYVHAAAAGARLDPRMCTCLRWADACADRPCKPCTCPLLVGTFFHPACTCARTCAHTRTPIHTHARTHARTHAHGASTQSRSSCSRSRSRSRGATHAKLISIPRGARRSCQQQTQD